MTKPSVDAIFKRIAADEGTKNVPMGVVPKTVSDHPFTLWTEQDMSGRITVHESGCRLCGRGKTAHGESK